jgi:hypothetical protein
MVGFPAAGRAVFLPAHPPPDRAAASWIAAHDRLIAAHRFARRRLVLLMAV